MMGLSNRYITRICDPTCMNKKPDPRGGGQGPSTFDEFAKQGLYLNPGDANRALKIRQFRERLKVPPPPIDANQIPELPMLLVYDTCEQFIRTIPYIQTHRTNVEDVDDSGEDHCYDEAALIAMARPLSQPDAYSPTAATAKIIDAIEKKGNTYEDEVENALSNAFMHEGDPYGGNPFDMGVTYDTV